MVEIDMDIRNLITFVHVAEMNSFTKAAAYLGYSQSTVSFQIKQLENEFNCQLFERINHSISLTQKGRELLEYAHQINKLTDEINENMTQGNEVSGNICLATADSLCIPLMKDKFVSFREKYPEIKIKLIVAGTRGLLRMIDCNEADAILTLDSHIYNTDYIVAKEEKVAVHYVAKPGFVEKETSNLSIRDIINYPFLLTEKGMSYRRIFDEKLSEMSLEIQPVFENGTAELLADLAEQGAGIALLPDYVVNHRIESGSLIRLDVKDLHIELWKQLLYHRRKWMTKQLEYVLNHFCDF